MCTFIQAVYTWFAMHITADKEVRGYRDKRFSRTFCKIFGTVLCKIIRSSPSQVLSLEDKSWQAMRQPNAIALFRSLTHPDYNPIPGGDGENFRPPWIKDLALAYTVSACSQFHVFDINAKIIWSYLSTVYMSQYWSPTCSSGQLLYFKTTRNNVGSNEL